MAVCRAALYSLRRPGMSGTGSVYSDRASVTSEYEDFASTSLI